MTQILYYIIDVIMWLKFSNSSTSVREIIVTSILLRFHQKSHYFEGLSCFKFNDLGMALSTALNFYTMWTKLPLNPKEDFLRNFT